MSENKYFISYAAYSQLSEIKIDFFNEIIYINEIITSDLINKLQCSFTDKLNNGTKTNPYFISHIIGITKLD